MPRYDFTTRRLFVDATLATGATVTLDRAQSHRLFNVLRLALGAGILVFNGRDGEFAATLESGSRAAAVVSVGRCTRVQTAAADLNFLFAPLKHARLDYMVQKAVEMGAARLQPVLTRRTQVERVNLDRMRANVVEAAEQCGILAMPTVAEPMGFEAVMRDWLDARWLVFCDEDAEVHDPLAALRAALVDRPDPSLGLIIGPEGGFDPQERRTMLCVPRVVRLSLGPRILRADTAAVAAMALVQAVAGDGRSIAGAADARRCHAGP